MSSVEPELRFRYAAAYSLLAAVAGIVVSAVAGVGDPELPLLTRIAMEPRLFFAVVAFALMVGAGLNLLVEEWTT